MEVVLIYNAGVRVAANVHYDIRFCLEGVYVMEWEEVLRLVLSHYFTCLTINDIKPGGLLVVPLHALVERSSSHLHRQECPHIHNERVFDKHEVVRSHGKTVVVAEPIFWGESGQNIYPLKWVWRSVSRGGGSWWYLCYIVASSIFQRNSNVIHISFFVLVGMRCHGKHSHGTWKMTQVWNIAYSRL